MNAHFLAIAQDPRIIPGVHHYCDEWCDYCPVTNRCLGFRCTEAFRKLHGRKKTEPTFASMEEAFTFTRELSAIEGLRTDELDAIISSPPGQSGVQTSDPLASVAWEYAERVAILMAPVVIQMIAEPPRFSIGGPAPQEVVVWYHLRIYMKVFRALVSQETSVGAVQQMEDARGCAQLAMVSVERSRDALRVLGGSIGEGEVDGLISLLDRLRTGLDERFPDPRSFVRLGLDHPVA